VDYIYDPVGNRKEIRSTYNPVPAGLMYYDANDRLAPDTYDDNGNIVHSVEGDIAYDFENHLIRKGGVTAVYDGDGNRVSKTVGGVTTNYLVDDVNPTGYVQVLNEIVNGGVQHYLYGLSLLEKTWWTSSGLVSNWYGYDGHGSVRFLTDQNGTVLNTYDYDAFGNLVAQTGTTPNNYLFAGEQWDPDLGLYYNRARYLDVRTGRFWGTDSYAGDPQSAVSLHKYLYSAGDPVDNVDPSGNLFVSTLLYGQFVHDFIGDHFERTVPGGLYDAPINDILNANVPGGSLRPDLIDTINHQVYEIKPALSTSLAFGQLAGYLVLLTKSDPSHNIWSPGVSYAPPTAIQIKPGTVAFVTGPTAGIITYYVVDLTEAVGMIAAYGVAQITVAVSTATMETAYAGFAF
jgi:RHS repeat-associated protein